MQPYKIVALVVISAMAVSALLLYATPQNPQREEKKTQRMTASPTIQTPQTIISFTPARVVLSGMESKDVTVQITTGSNTISAAQLEIRYDPTKITISSVRPADFFPSPTPLLNTHDRGRGRIDFVLTMNDMTQPVSGNGTLAILTLSRNPAATASAKTQIDLLPKTSVRSAEQEISLLKSTGSTTIDLEAISGISPSP